MGLFKRFFYYLIGVSLGSIIVFFIWTGKDVSFDYGMDARTLKTIRTKTLVYSNNVKLLMYKSKIDSTAIEYILSSGDVDFGKSNQHKMPCPEYSVNGSYLNKELELWIIRCDSIATIDKVLIQE
ncbi:MAG: DUF4258 domain-containing protein [Flavobacteriaceae bacterium]|jgi:hypothetical protein|tara:strand:- start:1978 stop:2352 length:375 start_codon:yes stop_codon:yes gene_type:complete